MPPTSSASSSNDPTMEKNKCKPSIISGRRRRMVSLLPFPSSAGIFPSVAFVLFLFLLFLFASPSANAAGGFRLCGLKLTMMLNAICKQQLCGGFVLTKKRSAVDESDTFLGDVIEIEKGKIWPANEPFARHWKVFHASDENDNESAEGNGQRWEEGKGGGGTMDKRSYPYGAFGSSSKKSGIATECCSKRCTLSYLKTYCCATGITLNDEEKEKYGAPESGENF